VFLADRILVMSARPGRIIDEVIPNLPDRASLDVMATPQFVRRAPDPQAAGHRRQGPAQCRLSKTFQPPPSPRGGQPPARRRDYRWLLSFGTLVALLALIEACIRGFDIPSYIFPAPSEIFKSLYAGFRRAADFEVGLLHPYPHHRLGGDGSFVCGSILGIALGGLIAEFPLLRRLGAALCDRPAERAESGAGAAVRSVVRARHLVENRARILLTFFPLMVNTVAGFASVEKDRLELMQSLKASPWKTFRYVMPRRRDHLHPAPE